MIKLARKGKTVKEEIFYTNCGHHTYTDYVRGDRICDWCAARMDDEGNWSAPNLATLTANVQAFQKRQRQGGGNIK